MEISISEIITICGGASIMISSIVGFLTQRFADRQNEKWRLNTESELKRLESELAQKSSLISNIIDVQKSNYNLSQERRILAIEKVWKLMNDFLFRVPNSFIYVNNLRESEYIEYLDKKEFLPDTNIKEDIERMDNDEEFVEIFRELRNGLTYERPFLGEDLYYIFHSYYTFVVRVILHNINSVKKNKLTHWQEDSYSVKLISKIASKEDFDYILKNKKSSYNYTLELIEKQIVQQMNLLLSGKSASEYSIKHLEEIKKILLEDNSTL
ncbi:MULTISPECIES: hypothetical protein [Chryseobacterium]|uniref:Phage abortive infection protein n=1 Tax=Chryseobacterium geocarposphaerae TaxID=1416776 RepID=A0ABU1LCX9_9FLAO|nr:MULTISPECIES: hypothetical protein [Chryseobacterium]MDR6404583.1 hypothetical protein [Chryseobacterium geocarposphaerae]MDR6698184.1 hypothetical protein [Chryseobacterium ginsenosidimutans]